MVWITDALAIGGLRDAIDTSALEAAGIESVLQLYASEREKVGFTLPLEVLQLPVRDREPLPPELLRQGLDFLKAQRAAAQTILVTCGAGISRSATFAASLLHEEGSPLFAAFQLLVERHPDARPHPALVESVIAYYHAPLETGELLRALARTRRGAPPAAG
jgi:protein-tyrosine phosphatase